MSLHRIKQIIYEIEELQRDIKRGSDSWFEGSDECAMAECDPSDQYCKSEEIDALFKELKDIINSI